MSTGGRRVCAKSCERQQGGGPVANDEAGEVRSIQAEQSRADGERKREKKQKSRLDAEGSSGPSHTKLVARASRQY